MEIIYSKQAVKNINGLDKSTKQRIKAGIENLPIGDIKKLKGYSNAYRLRIGDYRVLFELYDFSIKIKAVLPRGSAYKNI